MHRLNAASASMGVASYSATQPSIRNRVGPRRNVGGDLFALLEKKLPRFNDRLAAWAGEDGSVTLPDDWQDSLTGDYDADIAESSDLSAAKIAEMQAQVDSLTAELSAAKAHNYDLMMNGSGKEPESDPENSANDGDGVDPSGSADISIDDLFGED